MTGDQCVDSYRRELGAGDVLRLAEAVHDNYRQMGNWSATDLHRNGMAIGTITEALQALGIEQPMPNCWKDSEQTATTKMDAVIRALRSAAASSARIKSPPMMETLVPHADGDGRSAGPPSLTAPGVKRKKGKRGALAKACALKRACPELDRDQVAKQIGCDRSLLSNDRYREVEKEAEAKLARAHAKRGIL
jgi:hypothetical protein